MLDHRDPVRLLSTDVSLSLSIYLSLPLMLIRVCRGRSGFDHVNEIVEALNKRVGQTYLQTPQK